MKRVFHNITVWFRDLTAVFCNEWRIIVHDMGALIFFLALPLLYPVVYTLIYNTEVVDKVPVAIIDDCRSEMSRQFVRDASAAPGIDVVGYAANLNEARRWMNEDKVYGILRIPSDYASDIETGQQATIEFYADMSLLLRYRALLAAVTDLQIKQTADITMNRVNMTGLETTGMAKMPIDSHHSFLGDPEQGFASFVMPGIVILILQQSMLLGISLIGGTSRERRMRNGGIDPEMIDSASASASVWGKALCYFVLYIPLTMYVTTCIPEMFDLPHYGSPVQYLPFMVPMLFASAFLGQALLPLMKERESAFLIVVFTSVVVLFAAGLTWPRYAMNGFWTWFSNLVPATWGVEGFIRINSNAATLAESARPFIAMWILTGVYFLCAWWALKWIRVRSLLKAKA
ncbi:MAG: ABC transporter permease [Muribaculaceae bacterium]|nr:ABC transporter permease [Muribaculaceae bacterium]